MASANPADPREEAPFRSTPYGKTWGGGNHPGSPAYQGNKVRGEQDRVWRAEPPQRLFLKSEEDTVLYGGAKGGGKSDALLMFSILRRRKFPGSKGLIIRKTFAELQKEGALIPRSFELLSGVAKYDHTYHKWKFPDGGVIEFGHCEHEKDVFNYQGSQYDDICVDQIEEFSEWEYKLLRGSLRTARKDLKPLLRATANPGNRGHAWVKKAWIDAAAPNTTFTSEEGLTSKFIPATVEDNPHLNPGYHKWLNELPEPWRTAWRFGRWDIFVGQMYSEWDPKIHTCEPFDIPRHWTRWTAHDWGHASPAWWGWFARADWGSIYLYREWYVAREHEGRWVGLQLNMDQMCARARDMMIWDEPMGPCYTGKDLFIKHGTTRSDQGTLSQSESLADVARRLGFGMIPADVNRVQGWQRIHRALQLRLVDINGKSHPEPELIIFNNCRHIIRTLPLLSASESHPEDIEDGQEDHPPDGLRYGLSLQPSRTSGTLLPFASATFKTPVATSEYVHDTQNLPREADPELVIQSVRGRVSYDW